MLKFRQLWWSFFSNCMQYLLFLLRCFILLTFNLWNTIHSDILLLSLVDLWNYTCQYTLRVTYYYWLLLIDESIKICFKKVCLKFYSVVDPWQVWQAIRHITNNKTNDLATADSDASVASELNCSFAHFKMKTPRQADTTPLPASNNYTLSVEEHDVRRVLKMGKPREAASPDGANHLSEVFTKIFKLSQLNPSSNPATIVPAPKKSTIHDQHD